MKDIKILKLIGDWDELKKIIVYTDNRSQIYETMSRNQAKLDMAGNFDISFCVIFDHYYQRFISVRRLGTSSASTDF